MKETVYTHLQLRELFHIEFLRLLGRKLKTNNYAVKGGVNLRLFFKSVRYSEDIDLDAAGIGVGELKELVMKILQARSFREGFYAFGIRDIIPPDARVAKQTQTTQCFKVHLITAAGEDLFTKIEFSRRGFDGKVITESIPAAILRDYRLSPLITPHYDAGSAVMQKIYALALRTAIQARDIFDLYVLSSQVGHAWPKGFKPPSAAILAKARERIFEAGFEMFRDTVVSYLADEDKDMYDNASSWEEIKLKVVDFIEELSKVK
jgi:predicted nucleotidyltransferase component of viral defense system